MPRQVLTMMIATMASVALPSQEKPLLTDAGVHEQPVDDAEGGIEDPHPGDRAEATVGTMKGRSRKARTRFRPRKCWLITRAIAEAAHQLEDRGHDRVDEGVAGDLPEHRVVGEGDEVAEPDEDARAWRPADPAGSGRCRRRTGRRRTRAGRGRPGASMSQLNDALPARGRRAAGSGRPATGAVAPAGRAGPPSPTSLCRSA